MRDIELAVHPAMGDVDTSRTLGNVLVRRYQILTTNWVKYVAYEPARGCETHTSLTTIDGVWYGEIMSRVLPDDLEALPSYSKVRSDAVHAYQEYLAKLATTYILALFPEDFEKRKK